MENRNLITILLIVLLVLTIGYIVYTEVDEAQAEKEQRLVMQGAKSAINQIVQQTSQCNQVPLRSQNKSVQIVSVDCIQQNK